MSRLSFLAPVAGVIVAILASATMGQTATQNAATQNAAAQNAAAPATQQTQRKTYQVGEFYLPASRVYVHVDKTGLGHEHAVVGMIARGRIVLGADKDAGEIIFDMKSFQADTEAARKYLGLEGTTDPSTQQQVNANMTGPLVLNVEEYPTAIFKATSALALPKPSRRGLPQYELAGVFTLHGVARPLKFLVEVEPSNGWQRIRGGFAINQTDFGIKPFTKAFGAVGVADRLTIWGDALAAPAAGGVAQAATTATR